MPAQSSLLSGLYPEQHAAVAWEAGLADSLTTLAEHLAASGYRTGAITDSYCVSRDFGFDQGFEWFSERRVWNIAETLREAREFMEADDGRPFFLFVQTYRTHMPYRSDDADIGKDTREVREELLRKARERGVPPPRDIPAARQKEIYERGVRDLDKKLGGFLDELEESGFFERAFLVFTSDHGEAFGEHGKLRHTGRPFEEEARIPLLVAGPGLVPADVDATASLVDLPRTIAALAGIPPAEEWGGVDLRQASGERAVYSFLSHAGESFVAFVEGERKVHALADPEALARGEHLGGYDLARDPGEQELLNDPWVSELCRAHAGRLAELLEPRATARRVELSAEDRAQLRAIGYGE
jgi:arylsulfatase